MLARDLLIFVYGDYQPPLPDYILLREYRVIIRGSDAAYLAEAFQSVSAELTAAESLAMEEKLGELVRSGGLFEDYVEEAIALLETDSTVCQPLVAQDAIQMSEAAWLATEVHAQETLILKERKARVFRGIPGEVFGIVELEVEPHQREGEGR